MTKRKNKENAYDKAYQGFRFRKRPSSGRPGSPHRFFAASYQVEYDNESDEVITPTVHQHANGLVVVSAGETLPSVREAVLMRQASSIASSNAAQKRRLQGKMLRGKRLDEDIVSPSDDLCRIGDQTVIAGVWGVILEVQSRPERIAQDPLLDGYVAIILPTGPFPPREKAEGSGDENEVDGDEPPTKRARADEVEEAQEEVTEGYPKSA